MCNLQIESGFGLTQNKVIFMNSYVASLSSLFSRRMLIFVKCFENRCVVRIVFFRKVVFAIYGSCVNYTIWRWRQRGSTVICSVLCVFSVFFHELLLVS